MALFRTNGEDLLTVEDVANRLGVTQKTVRKMIKRGDIQPLAGLGGALAFREREIERFEREASDPHLMNVNEMARYYGIDRHRARKIFRPLNTLVVKMDPRRGMLYDLSRSVHRHIEARYRLTPRRGENGSITFDIDS